MELSGGEFTSSSPSLSSNESDPGFFTTDEGREGIFRCNAMLFICSLLNVQSKYGPSFSGDDEHSDWYGGGWWEEEEDGRSSPLSNSQGNHLHGLLKTKKNKIFVCTAS